jgi:hydrogenase-4 component B
LILAILPVIPLIGALFLLFKRGRFINIPLITSAVVLILGVCGLKSVFEGLSLYYTVHLPGPYAPNFHADSLSAIFVLTAAFIWLVVSIYGPQYMEHEGRTKAFELCTLLTLSAVLGVFLAGDMFTLLLFFELMTISSFFWVIHRRNKEAIRAGYFYLFYSIIGGLFLALGIVLMSSATDVIPNIGSGLVNPSNSRVFAWSIALLVVGFGIKAGMVPLHLWLPHAHSVAPTPGSALLSGLLIKVGAYGLIRVGEFAGWGTNLQGGASQLGSVLAILGTCTMLVGVLTALIQSDAKRLLAYHSISQIGYIVLGLGIGLYLGSDGSLALIGSIYHIVNHALFKVALFLGVGIIYIGTNETNLYKLGGLWRRFPLTALLMLIAVLGITGAPGLNGYASKTLLHHAVSYAAEKGAQWFTWIERLFLLVGVGTATSFIKLYYLIFLGKPAKTKVDENKSTGLHLAMGLLTVVMVGIGLMPKTFVNIAAAPAAQVLGMKNATAALDGLSFWNLNDVLSMVITLAIGVLVCWFGFKSGVFHWHPPAFLTLEGLGKLIYMSILSIWKHGVECCSSIVSKVRRVLRTLRSRLFTYFHRFSQSRSGTIGKITLAGISADAAILIAILMFLIVWYTIIIK